MSAVAEPLEQLLVSTKAAASALGISTRSLWTLTNQGAIDFVRVGRSIKYSPEHLREFVERSTSRAAA